MEVTYFETPLQFRQWLEKNHEVENELLVGFYKTGSGTPGITWPQAVDEALCFGWIDAVRRSIDKDRYQIRFTKRKPGSIWSAVNISKVERLTRLGLMHPAGIKSYERRTEKRSKIYAYEKEAVSFSAEFEKKFKENKTAWKYFQSLAPSYRKLASHWVMSAKQEPTRIKRMNELISDSALLKNRWKDNKYSSANTRLK